MEHYGYCPICLTEIMLRVNSIDICKEGHRTAFTKTLTEAERGEELVKRAAGWYERFQQQCNKTDVESTDKVKAWMEIADLKERYELEAETQAERLKKAWDERDNILKDEHALSESYVCIRAAVGTAHKLYSSTEEMWKATEQAAEKLAADAVDLKRVNRILEGQLDEARSAQYEAEREVQVLELALQRSCERIVEMTGGDEDIVYDAMLDHGNA